VQRTDRMNSVFFECMWVHGQIFIDDVVTQA